MEVEIKLLLRPSEVPRLRQNLPPAVREVVQHNRYLDDAARTLARAGWGLRVRLELEGGSFASATLTLKHSGDEAGEFTRRPEFEVALPSAELDPVAALRLARGLLPDPGALPELVPDEIGRMENHRALHLLPGTPPVRLELDHTVWPDGSESDELEVELDDEVDPDPVRQRVRELFDVAQIPWRVGRESKLERLLRML